MKCLVYNNNLDMWDRMKSKIKSSKRSKFEIDLGYRLLDLIYNLNKWYILSFLIKVI